MRILSPFLGARIIKTGLAVFLALVTFHWVGSGYGTFAAVAAVIAVQPSVSRARQIFIEQFIANLIAGAVGAVLGLWLGSGALPMALGVILVLGLCTRFGLTEAAGLAVVAVIFIMDRPQQDFLFYTGARIGAIAGGMLIGAVINRYIRPPDLLKRMREELDSAHEAMSTFGHHLIASLEEPDLFQKEQIKAEAASIQRRVDTARYYLDLYQESNPADPVRLLMEKAKSSMFVFAERIMDIHKIVLQVGGLPPGPAHDAVAGALRSVLKYKKAVMGAVLHGGRPDPEKAAAYHRSLATLEQLVTALVDEPDRRALGLALHGVLTNIRHMGWRMESLSRLLQDVT